MGRPQRSAPTDGCAQGMPLNTTMPSLTIPSTMPTGSWTRRPSLARMPPQPPSRRGPRSPGPASGSTRHAHPSRSARQIPVADRRGGPSAHRWMGWAEQSRPRQPQTSECRSRRRPMVLDRLPRWRGVTHLVPTSPVPSDRPRHRWDGPRRRVPTLRAPAASGARTGGTTGSRDRSPPRCRSARVPPGDGPRRHAHRRRSQPGTHLLRGRPDGERRFWGCFLLRRGVIPPESARVQASVPCTIHRVGESDSGAPRSARVTRPVGRIVAIRLICVAPRMDLVIRGLHRVELTQGVGRRPGPRTSARPVAPASTGSILTTLSLGPVCGQVSEKSQQVRGQFR